jgi:hypothetical protein
MLFIWQGPNYEGRAAREENNDLKDRLSEVFIFQNTTLPCVHGGRRVRCLSSNPLVD